MARDSAVARLFGDAASSFWSSCWPKPIGHLFARGVEARLPDLFASSALATLDGLWAARPKLMGAQSMGADGVPTLENDITIARARECVAAQIPVHVFAVDRFIPAVEAVTTALAEELGFPRALFLSTIFISPPGRGLPKHYDDRDVWLIGLGGEKRVTVAVNRDVPHPDSPYMPHRAPSIDPLGLSGDMPADHTDIDVARGDCLFMPRGIWHATAASAHVSWSLSIGVRRPTWGELATQALSRQLARDAMWREPVASLRSVDAMRVPPDLFSGLANVAAHVAPESLLPGAPPTRFGLPDDVTVEIVRGPEGCDAVFRSPGDTIEVEIEEEYAPVIVQIGALRTDLTAARLARAGVTLSPAEIGGVLQLLADQGLLVEED